ncbi:dihydrofolate reductase family protein [Kitasatospora sp. NPDC056651]|uniref:dihydrofolate reductase family protein n=1 Tax=Kitasatospora sp. NPDC056651 TaxID=3345892 RepID=UPI00368EEDD2
MGGTVGAGRLVVAMQVSADGFVNSEVPVSDWQLWNWGPDWPWSADLRSSFNALLAEASGILLSRPMADEGYLGHWERMAALHPGDGDWDFARAIGALPKFALSRTGRPRRDWPRTEVLTGRLADTAARAKAAAGGRLLCFGGAGLVSALLREGLAEELRLFVNPGFAGAGTRVFGPWLVEHGLRFDGVSAYDCGVVESRWSQG